MSFNQKQQGKRTEICPEKLRAMYRRYYWEHREEIRKRRKIRYEYDSANRKFHPDKLRNSKLGEKNPMWKGDKVGRKSLHEWLTNYKPKPELCEECGKSKPYDLANISGRYLRDVNDYRWLGRRCHMILDGRMQNCLLHWEVNYATKNAPRNLS